MTTHAASPPTSDSVRLTRYAWLSIATAIATIALKSGAYALTGSVGLLSDALESLVNLVAALVTLRALTVSARPADEDHAFGHSKAEYFSSAFEGALVLLAAVMIAWTAIDRLLHPVPLDRLGVGIVVSVGASAINFVIARVLYGAARTYRSIALEADAHHLMTDVWTSVGVLVGVALVAVVGWQPLDAIVALIVAVNITRVGVSLVRRSMLGLLDTALPPETLDVIAGVFASHQARGVQFHALRTRQAGARAFISTHVLVPGDWTVREGHDLLERIERELRAAVPNATVDTHLEPIEDPASWEDVQLERR